MPVSKSIFIPSFILLIIAACSLSGCATIGHDASNQAVLVQSDPPGAEITLDGKVVGSTPMYVLVPREKNPKLTLSRDGIEKRADLKPKYRWGASFFSNLVFYVAAPVGWVVDMVSGAAWNPQDPEVVSLKKGEEDPANEVTLEEILPPLTAIAIAPPRAESLELSNAAIPVIEDAISERKGFSGYHILPYEQSLPLFLARGFDYDGNGSEDEKRMLYQSLNANGIWHTNFVRDGDSMKLEAELEDTRTHQITDEFDLLLDPSDERSKAFAQGFNLFTLPNAVTFSLSTQYFTYDRPGAETVSLQAADLGYWWQKGLQYLSQISITNLPVYRPDRAGRWSLNFIPVLKISRRDLIANGAADVGGQEFLRWLGTVGYGPELGYQVGRHYLYADLNLNAVWTDISWSHAGQDYSVTKGALQTSLEIGYLYSINDIWSLRVFASSFPENSEAWGEALRKSSTKSQVSQQEGVANNSTIGISVGFSYEPFFVRTFREKIRKAPSRSPAPDQASN
jgi:hypothetical protein